jgi:hypothetical protein
VCPAKNARKRNATHITSHPHGVMKQSYIGPKDHLGIYITDIEKMNILKFQNI